MPKIGLAEKTELKEKIIKIDDTKAIRYRVVEEEIDLIKLSNELNYAQQRLSQIPISVPDETLLAWARLNHPDNMNYEVEKQTLQNLIATNQAILEGIK